MKIPPKQKVNYFQCGLCGRVFDQKDIYVCGDCQQCKKITVCKNCASDCIKRKYENSIASEGEFVMSRPGDYDDIFS